MDLIHFGYDLLKLFIFILPAMVANGTPVIVHGLPPIDMGKKWRDGRRIFGDGKTWGGILSGIIAGLIIGSIESVIIWHNMLYDAFIASFGALIGDLIASFIKRRIGLERGAPAPLLDQLDFYVGALVFLYLFDGKIFNIYAELLFAVLIYALHRTTNYMAYKLKLKNVPW
ncbi:CDP-diglyceride synthetase [Caldisphaera lagunensis DSM 15908]|uniref:CDP-archaeol synthase n=1 Tax=Caldisphaera lagunensis (strain DSM 15908 / JCM 11604 / ANMR 0165 / IC-154) TaxID=1056495 RepID=L0ACV9_CALLD|nr:CDP-2,3-bis-(O-geranylgeranyl)-sn-glycerol synthase [Caldisphaera lagunensis]AFZ70890.1 CDP-diglyceride synthetase [Caldisphaera lagunensis DSM 15908]